MATDGMAVIEERAGWDDCSRMNPLLHRRSHWELSGWANREGLDLWDSSVSAAFTAFVREPDDGTEDTADRGTVCNRHNATDAT